MKMKPSTIALGILGALFLLSRKAKPVTSIVEPPIVLSSPKSSVPSSRTKAPRFLRGDALRNYNAVAKAQGSWGMSDLERLQILESTLTTVEFNEVLASLGTTRQNWEILQSIAL